MAISVKPKLRGRPPTGRDPLVGTRMPKSLIAAIDAYAAQQPAPKPSRSETIRKILEDRLVHEGLITPGEGVGTRT